MQIGADVFLYRANVIEESVGSYLH
jgi:hypothetical protein